MVIRESISKRLLFSLLASALLLACSERAAAQVRRYQPRSPTVSPYLNLTRLNTGAVPNYHSLVRPMQNQIAINEEERAFRKNYAGKLLQLQNDVQQGLVPVTATGKASGFMVGGNRSQFNYHSQFYRGVQPYRIR